MAHRVTIDQPAEKSATNPLSLKELLDTNLKIVIAIIGFATIVAGATWGALEKTRIESLKEQVAFWKEQIAERDKTVSELKAARDPDRKKIDESLATNQKLENDLAVVKDNLKQSRDNNAELQKRIKTYEINGSIFSKVRDLEKRKETIEKARVMWVIIPTDISLNAPKQPATQPYTKDELRQLRQVGELQARILDLQQKLACEPK